ncbi:hypothetical protein [Pseudonocardia lacus]|uniref:hypothetical protein n=1 Tax=Pseudonocardia lacus TaxID=2835865 RepID=UPI001BDC6D9C|nr:hypothetical protein [Pseudonocardia lacus]
MPSSMIFLGLVVVWLLILVPAVARHRQEVARPTSAALSGRVLDRPRHGRDRDRGRDARAPVGARDQEVDVTEHDEEQRSVAVADDERPPPAEDERAWERPPSKFRRGRGGFDPEAAALAAKARYAFRQRVVLVMLVLAVATALVAALAATWVWWLHGGVDAALVGYLAYLRRQVRLEESIRRRRAARMAGTRRTSAADDPDLDEWARRGRTVSGGAGRETVADAVRRAAGAEAADRHDTDPPDGYDDAYDHDAYDDDRYDDDRYDDEDGYDEADDAPADARADDEPDELAREEPERVSGTGAPLWRGPGPGLEMMEVESALPRREPVPTPPLPAGTALVDGDLDDPDLHDLDESPHRPDYRRAAGE